MRHKNLVIRPELVQWLVLPSLLIWFSASYLLGVSQPPQWQDPRAQKTPQVLAAMDVTTQATESASIFKWQHTGLVTFWFDDGWLTQYTQAAPIMQANGLKAAIAIPTQLIGYDAYMSWGQVKRLYHTYNWEITAHSRTHNCDASTFTPEGIKNEVLGSYDDLISNGLSVDQYVVPCGVITPELEAAVSKYFVSLRTSEGGLNPLPLKNPYHLYALSIHDGTSINEIKTWLTRAADEKQWLILMFHQVDDSMGEYSLKPEFLQQIIDAVKSNPVSVVLPSQVMHLIP